MIYTLINILFVIEAKDIVTADIVPSTNYIRTVANYSISFVPITTIPNGGFVQILLPPIFEVLTSAYPCFEGTVIETACTCIHSSGVLIVSNCFTQSLTLVRISIQDFPNPLYSTTGYFTLSTYSPANSLIDSTSSAISVVFLPLNLKFASISPVSQIVSDITTWEISLFISYELNKQDFIQVSIPSGYCSNNLTCSGIFVLNCFCNSSIYIEIGASIAGNVSLAVTGLINPISTASVSGFQILTLNILGIIEESSVLSVQVNIPANITTEVKLFPTGTSQIANYELTCSCSAPVPENSDIQIVVPKECVPMPDFQVIGIVQIPSNFLFIINQNVIDIPSVINSYLSGGTILELNLTNVKNPNSTEVSSSGKIIISNNGSFVCQGLFSVRSSFGKFDLKVVALDLTIQEFTNYEIYLTFDYILENSSFLLQFPNEIDITTSFCNGCTIDNGIRINMISGFSLNFTVFHVLNSEFPGPTTCFNATMFTDSTFQFGIANNDTQFLVFTAKSLNATVSPSNYVTGNFAIYTFSFWPSQPVPVTGTILVTFPPQIIIQNTTVQISNVIGFSSGFITNISQSTIKITNGFANSSASIYGFSIPLIKNPGTEQEVTIYAEILNQGFQIETCNLAISMNILNAFKFSQLVLSSYQVGAKSTYFFKFVPYNVPIDMLILTFPYDLSYSSCNLTCYFNNSLFIKITDSTTFQINNVSNPGITSSYLVKVQSSYQGFFSDSSDLVYNINFPGQLASNLTVIDDRIGVVTNYILNISTQNSVPLGGYLSIEYLTQSIPICYFQAQINCNYLNGVFSLYIFPNQFSGNISIVLKNITNSIESLSSFKVCTKFSNNFIDCASIPVPFSCTSPCQNCQVSDTNCTSCLSSYFLYNSSCRLTCPAGYYGTNAICVPCLSPCSSCLNATFCYSCLALSPFNLNGSCLIQCPKGYFSNNSYTCLKCPQTCSSCQSGEICNSCLSGVLFNGTCTQSCPEGWYQNSSLCLECSANCKICFGYAACQECSAGLLYEGNCIDKCPEGISIELENKCVPCNTECKSCSKSTNNCTSCVIGPLFQNNCFGSCPTGYFSSSSVCNQCSQNCSECLNTFTCLGCKSGFFLFADNCVDICPINTLPISGVCTCPSNCETCSSNGCSTCATGFMLLNNTCVSECPQGYFKGPQDCLPCQNLCSTCLNSSKCLSCVSGSFLFSNSCFSQCPNSTLESGSQCLKCQDPCLGCQGTYSNCTSCQSPFLLFNETCIQTCPQDFYPYFSQCLPISYQCAPNCSNEMLNNNQCDWDCYFEACNFDNGNCPPTNYSNALDLVYFPLPFSIANGLVLLVSSFSSLFFQGSFLPTSTSLLSILETPGITSLLGILVNSNGKNGRITLDIEDSREKLIFSLSLIIFSIQILLNFLFGFIYFKWIATSEPSLKKWSRDHLCAYRFICFVSIFINYKFFRMCVSGFFGIDACKVNLYNSNLLSRPFLYFNAISIIFVNLPILGVVCSILGIYSHGSYSFMVAIDVIILMSISVFLNGIDICLTKSKIRNDLHHKDKQANYTENSEIDTKTV